MSSEVKELFSSSHNKDKVVPVVAVLVVVRDCLLGQIGSAKNLKDPGRM